MTSTAKPKTLYQLRIVVHGVLTLRIVILGVLTLKDRLSQCSNTKDSLSRGVGSYSSRCFNTEDRRSNTKDRLACV